MLPRVQAGWASCASLRAILLDLKKADKGVAVLLSQGGGNQEVYIASAADRVFLSTHAGLFLMGLSVQAQYVKQALDRLGVKFESFARKEFKTAAERVTRDAMSEPQREQLNAILQSHMKEIIAAITKRTGQNEQAARALFQRGFIRGQAAVKTGLVDAVGYEDELPAMLGTAEKPARLVPAPKYFAYKEARLLRPLRPPPYLAVIPIKGVISESGRPTGRRESLVAALREVSGDAQAVGVVLLIDSPGGSADASDLIHREVTQLKLKKPVVACFGDVAASGGYYVAAPANAIIAQPLTLTGSIGVVSARMVASTLLEKIGVRTEVVRTAPHADLFSFHRELTEEERVILNDELDAFYRVFVEIVAAGRARPEEEIESLAKGRVWSGVDALERGLVDRMGGLDVALEEVRKRVKKLPPHVVEKLEPALVIMTGLESAPPPPQTWIERLQLPYRDLIEVASLVTEDQSALYHAFDLPRVR